MSTPITITSLVLSSGELEKSMVHRAKQCMRRVYDQDTSEIFFRFTATQSPIHNEAVFLLGNGKIYTGTIPVYVTLVHYLNLISKEEIERYSRTLKELLPISNPVILAEESVETRSGDYTAYLKFGKAKDFMNLRRRVIDASQSYFSKETYQKYFSIQYVPHSTIIYDDVDRKSVAKVASLYRELLTYGRQYTFDEIVLWKTILSENGSWTREKVASFSLY